MSKVRTGFVSNSSSSSFIIGIGKVKNVEKLRNEVKNLKLFGVIIDTYGNILEQKPFGVDIDSSYIGTEAFDGSSVYLRTDVLKNEDYVVVLNEIGPHDDSDFEIYDQNDGEFLEYDYDIDLDMGEALEAMESLLYNSELVEYAETRKGAGRNG